MKQLVLALSCLFSIRTASARVESVSVLNDWVLTPVRNAFVNYKNAVNTYRDADDQRVLERNAFRILRDIHADSIEPDLKKIIKMQVGSSVSFHTIGNVWRSAHVPGAMWDFYNHSRVRHPVVEKAYRDLEEAVTAAVSHYGVKLYMVNFDALNDDLGAGDYYALILVNSGDWENIVEEPALLMLSFDY